MTSLDVIEALLPLFLLVILLFGALYFIKKRGFGVHNQANKIVGLKVLSTQTIVPKKYVSVIKIRDKLLVVGVADNSVSLLKELDLPDDYHEDNTTNMMQGGFKDILRKNIGLK